MRLPNSQDAAAGYGQSGGEAVLAWRDIAALVHDQGIRLVAPDLQPDDAALRGLFVRRHLRDGLTVHMSDAVDLHNLTTRVVNDAGLTVTLFLAGRANISLAGRRQTVGASRDAGGRTVPMLTLCSLAEPEIFERCAIRGEHLRKVSIRVSPDWLENVGLAGPAARLAHDHGIVLTKPAPHGLARLADRMLGEVGDVSPCADLMLEARALELFVRALETASDDMGSSPSASPRAAHDETRLRLAREFMAANLDQDLTLADIARHACVSVSTLQRLFRVHTGMPVSQYLRQLRLEDARAFLERGEGTVTEAALRAGYNSPANFATAFKRHFGIPPSQCRR